jgi:hypothetical protein
MHREGGNIDWLHPDNMNREEGSSLKQVMEAGIANPEGKKEGPPPKEK